MTIDDDAQLSLSEAARLLGFRRRKVYTLAKIGKVEYRRTACGWRIRFRALMPYLALAQVDCISEHRPAA